MCNIRYFKPSVKDTAETQAQALKQNMQLRDAGCPEDGSGRKFSLPKLF